MQDDRVKVAARSANVRSRVTNGTRAILFGDGRSAGARRYRDLFGAFASELGLPSRLEASAQQIVRRAAHTCVECELLEAERASGAVVDPIAYATAYNANRRALRDLQSLKARAAGRAPTIAETLAKNAREAVAA